MGVARGDTWAMVSAVYKFHDVSPISPVLQKGKKVVLRLSEYGDKQTLK